MFLERLYFILTKWTCFYIKSVYFRLTFLTEINTYVSLWKLYSLEIRGQQYENVCAIL